MNLKIEDDEFPDEYAEINFEEKVCLELKEMGVLDIESDELRAWMISRYRYEGEDDEVKNKPGVENDMYKNGP
jgi:hypothetical protein